jgi:glucokinase
MGGTSAKIALVDERHRIVRYDSVPTGSSLSPLVLSRKLAAAIRSLAGRKVRFVGVGVAGDIDFHRGVIRVSPNLGWKNVPLKKLLEKKIDDVKKEIREGKDLELNLKLIQDLTKKVNNIRQNIVNSKLKHD